jgi:hypothetical protein
MVCLLFVVDWIWASQVGLTIGEVGIKLGIIFALLVFAAACGRRDRGIANLAESIALLSAITSTGAVLTYLAATCAFPLQDMMFAQWDRSIGFDWKSWQEAVRDRPQLYHILYVAYNSMIPQAFFALVYFSPTDRSARVGQLVLLAGAAAAAAALISAIWPALGPFALHRTGDHAYAVWVKEARDVVALRASGPWYFEFSAMQGIVSMPSYHTVMAVLLTYAFRGTGLVGYGIAALNVVMLLSIPPMGGHYLVDMLAGGMIALGAIAVQRAWPFAAKSSPVSHAV